MGLGPTGSQVKCPARHPAHSKRSLPGRYFYHLSLYVVTADLRPLRLWVQNLGTLEACALPFLVPPVCAGPPCSSRGPFLGQLMSQTPITQGGVGSVATAPLQVGGSVEPSTPQGGDLKGRLPTCSFPRLLHQLSLPPFVPELSLGLTLPPPPPPTGAHGEGQTPKAEIYGGPCTLPLLTQSTALTPNQDAWTLVRLRFGSRERSRAGMTGDV